MVGNLILAPIWTCLALIWASKYFLEVSALRDVRCSACSAWYPNLTKKLKHRIKTTQNKSVRFCLQLNKLKHISHELFTSDV